MHVVFKHICFRQLAYGDMAVWGTGGNVLQMKKHILISPHRIIGSNSGPLKNKYPSFGKRLCKIVIVSIFCTKFLNPKVSLKAGSTPKAITPTGNSSNFVVDFYFVSLREFLAYFSCQCIVCFLISFQQMA